MLDQVVQAVRGGQYRTPKTILGFLASLIAIVGITAVGLAFALAGTSSLHYVIVGFVVFVILLICAAAGTVIIFAWKDPSKLMLGEITGTDYYLIQQQIRGDNTSGEYVVTPGIEPVEERSDEQSTEPVVAIEEAMVEEEDDD